jgi:hypothetical protein
MQRIEQQDAVLPAGNADGNRVSLLNQIPILVRFSNAANVFFKIFSLYFALASRVSKPV